MHKVVEVRRDVKQVKLKKYLKETISLAYIQDIVKGSIQPVTYPNGVIIWTNEDGLYQFENDPVTVILHAASGYDTAYLKGDLLITGSSSKDIVGLTEKQLRWLDIHLKPYRLTADGFKVYGIKDPSCFM